MKKDYNSLSELKLIMVIWKMGWERGKGFIDQLLLVWIPLNKFSIVI